MIDSGKILGRGISFPPRINDGRLAWSEGEVNVREAIRIILMTEQRERLRLPEFGGSLGVFLFEANTVTTRQLIKERIGRALTRWEPRISVQSIDVDPDPADAQGVIATITYKLIATQVRERISLTVTLAS